MLGRCRERGIRIVSNAGGLDPAGCAAAIAEFAPGHPYRVRHRRQPDEPHRRTARATGDAAEEFRNRDTGEAYDAQPWPTLTANAYLGSAEVAAALAAGADVVVTGRITDAALVVGPAAWWHGWDLADPAQRDAVAGAIIAGHVIECGAQATGGNYPSSPTCRAWNTLASRSRRWPPTAPASSPSTGTPAAVSVGTVTAQLLYEVGSPTYLTPDGTALFDSVRIDQVGCNRVRLQGRSASRRRHDSRWR